MPSSKLIRVRVLVRLVVASVVTGTLLLGACSSGSDDVGQAAPDQREPTEGPAEGAEVRDEALPLFPATGLLLGTPIYDGDFADPFVLRVGSDLYAYATNDREANVPGIAAADPPFARYLGDVLPELPAWSAPGFVWAPAVLALDDGYVLYYATRVRGTSTQCVSHAISASPSGPFVDDSTEPFVCQRDLGGTIDPSVVTDEEGTHWLLYKNDGNCCGIPTSIWIQQLGPDGRSLVGDPSELLTAEPEWEGGLIEGPSMILDGDGVYLFYSANAWDSASYAIGYATCESLTGPCRRSDAVEDRPWMSSTRAADGPGGQEFFVALGDVWMVYHGWERGEAGEPGAERRLYLDIVRIDDGHPTRVGRRRAASALFAILVVVIAAVVAAVMLWRRRRRRREGRRATAVPMESRPDQKT